MLNLAGPLRRMCVVAGLAIMAVAAQAFIFDGQIKIDRALNSPTLTVRYTNAAAALVELRVNGESVATRTVNAGKDSGETTFNLNLGSLNGGDNKIEIRLFDKSGKQLASETTTVTTEATQGPVFLTNPKMGATLQGKVNIKIGFGREMKNSYVSFFIDNQFKSISNVAPFDFTWDTTNDKNGWHEVEAWVVDDTSATFKTRKVRVFVQNPGGPTARIFDPRTTPAVKPAVNNSVAPAAGGYTANALHPSVGAPTSPKPATIPSSVPMGLKEMLPTGTRLALSAAPIQKSHAPIVGTIKNVTSAAATGRVSITRGKRLPPIGTFAIVFNTQFVDFDVQPRVSTDGVPLTPFRYLIEKAGGKVGWANVAKNVSAQADGHDIFLHIGDSFAQINKQRVELEKPSFIDSGRTIVPLSFIRDALNVNIDYDRASGHVLITSVKK
jgi:hypothetical protein